MPLVADAARIAAVFGLDPVALLAERDSFARAVRVACYNVLVRKGR